MLHRLLYGETSRELWHTPPERVSSATYTVEDIAFEIGSTQRSIVSSTAASVDSLSLTTDDAAGAGEANPRRVPVASTTGAVIGDPCVIVSADGSSEAFGVEGIGSGAYLIADRELTGAYASGSAVYGVRIVGAFPDDTGDDEEYTEEGRVLRVVWTYDVRGKTRRVQEQIRMVRHDHAGDLDYAAARDFAIAVFPDIKDRMPQTDPRQLDRWILAAAQEVNATLRRQGIVPQDHLHGDDITRATAYRALIFAGQNSACPAAMSPSEFIEEMRFEYKNTIGAMVTGLPGAETADVPAINDTALSKSSVRNRSPFTGW